MSRFSFSKLFFILLGIQLLLGCAAKENLGDQKDDKSEILLLLNRGDNQGALDRINQALAKNPNDVELKYFKAQAYSSLTGIDIYSLFDVLKIKLFEVAMTEWQSYQRYKTLTESSTLNGIDPKDRDDALAALDHIREKLNLIEPENVPYEVVLRRPEDLREKCQVYVTVVSNLLRELDQNHALHEEDSRLETWGSLPVGDTCTEAEKNNMPELLYMRKHLLSQAKYSVGRRINEIINQKKMAAYVQGVYVLFDAVPILKQLASYKYSNLALTSQALELLQSIRQEQGKGSHFGKNSRNQILLISTYLLASALKDSLDIGSIVRPIDIVCRLQPEKVVEHYELGIVAARHLFQVIRDTDYFEAHKAELDKENAFELSKQFLLSLPDQITDKIKKQIIYFIRHVQRDRC